MKKSEFIEHFKCLVREIGPIHHSNLSRLPEYVIGVLIRTEPPGQLPEQYTEDHPYVLTLLTLYKSFYVHTERTENFHYTLPLIVLDVLISLDKAWDYFEEKISERDEQERRLNSGED